MKEFGRILKKYMFGIIIIIVLLVLQAYCDLELPGYTSDIINVGIQQQGVEESIPEAISKNSLDSISTLLGNDELYNYYDLIEVNNKKYIEDYPYLNTKDIYVLKDLNDEDKNKLSELMLNSEIIYYILQESGMFEKLGYEINPTTLTYFMNINEDSQIKQMMVKYDSLDDAMKSQYGTSYVISEYKTLGIDLEAKQMSYLKKAGIKMIILSIIIMVVIIVTVYLSGRIASMFARDLRSSIVKKVMSYSNSEYNQFSTSSLITRSTNDIQQIQMMFTMALRMVMYAPIIGIGALVKVAGINMTWVIGIAVGIILVFMILLFVLVMPKFQLVQKLIDRVNQVVREVLNGLPVIRAFANEDFEKEKFDKANKDLTKVNLFTQRAMALMSPVMMLVMNGIIVLIYWVGAGYIDGGAMQVGTLTALISYTMQIIMSFLMISMVSIMAPRAIISIKRIGEIFNKESSILEKDITVGLDKDKHGKVEFKNVSFQYPDGDELVLDGLDFVIEGGTTTSIIGSTGSGKSTIVNLIPRFFDVTHGEILVDGVNIKDVSLSDLRDIIGVVPQKGLLFSGTIESNIKFSNENMSDDVMKKAAKVACADEFINKKEEGYHSEISQGGTNVSGGQRQRLAIARAVAKNPEIYIFDDSFSALDYKTDSIVRKNLAEECKDATKIIVAQRISTVMNSDQIIVLEDGKVVGIGKHKDLLNNCSVYKEIALSQLKKEEL